MKAELKLTALELRIKPGGIEIFRAALAYAVEIVARVFDCGTLDELACGV